MAVLQFAAALNMTDDPQPRENTDDCTLGPEQLIRILSISPEEEDHTALFQILDKLPFRVTTARTCLEAAACLGLDQFGIILCECRLPDGNWTEILNRIEDVAGQPLLIVTSRVADVSLWAEVLNLGGYDLLAKPFSHQEVRHVLTSAWVQRANPIRSAAANS
jgi:DNA-binding NtrC family response regulator